MLVWISTAVWVIYVMYLTFFYADSVKMSGGIVTATTRPAKFLTGLVAWPLLGGIFWLFGKVGQFFLAPFEHFF